MTRCCSSFSNCCPEPAPVTITINQYTIGPDDIGFRVERLLYDDFTAVVPCDGDPAGAKWWASLGDNSVHPHAVSLRLAGTVDQRPLIGTSGTGALAQVATPLADEEFDFLVTGNLLYLFFDIAEGDVIYIKYIGETANDE